jgi:drug/metabolite transporter (DMT)-like permease
MEHGAKSLYIEMSSPRVRLWLALWTVYLVWGSTYLGIKLAVRTLPPVLTAGTRFLLAAAILAGVLAVARRTLRTTRREALTAAGLGVVLLGAGVGMVHVAETRIDSSVAAMIAGSVPLQIVAWRTLARDRVARGTVIASLVGLAGLALVVVSGGFDGRSAAVGLVVMVAASLAWSRGSFVAGRLRLPGDPFVATTYEMLGGGIALVLAATILGEWGDLSRAAFAPGPVAAWLYLAVAGSVVGFSAYVWLLGNAPISQVVTHQYVNPIVAVGLGALLLGERPSPMVLAGAVLIIGAVVVTVRREAPPVEPAAAEQAEALPATARAATAESHG